MSLHVEIEKHNDYERLILKGPLDESSGPKLRELLHRTSPKTVFNFSGIAYINSLGVRNWMNFLRSFSESRPNRKIVFEECTFDIISQINMFRGFRGEAEITSFIFDFFCESCNAEYRELFETTEKVETLTEAIKSRKCPSCGDKLEQDEPVDIVLNFLS